MPRLTAAEQLDREEQVRRLTEGGFSADAIAGELDIDPRTVKRYRALLARGQDGGLRRQERERLRLERALITGLSSGGGTAAIAASAQVTLRLLTYHLDQLKIRYGARTNAHLVAILAAERPCPHCGHIP